MLATEEATVHRHFKDAILSATDDSTVLISVPGNPTMRVLRNAITEQLADCGETTLLGRITDLYFDGEMDASVANTGQVSARIDAVLPVARVIEEMWSGCTAALEAGLHRSGTGSAPGRTT